MAVGWKGCWGCIHRLLETIPTPSLGFKEVEFRKGEVDAPRSLATLRAQPPQSEAPYVGEGGFLENLLFLISTIHLVYTLKKI